MYSFVCVCFVCLFVCVCACVRACVRARVRACVVRLFAVVCLFGCCLVSCCHFVYSVSLVASADDTA